MNTILIIEDEKALLSVLKAKLQSDGFNILTATNGVEGFEVLENNIPDLIFLDIVMPEMNGFEFMKRIKQDERFKNIPICVLTNLSEESDNKQMKDLKTDGFLIKTDLDLRHVADVTTELLEKAAMNKREDDTSQTITTL